MGNPVQPPQTPHERTWRRVFFYLSAVMGALALVDFDAGRFAHGLGDAGVACLLLSLITRYPFIQALVRADSRHRSRDQWLQEMEKLRSAQSWSDRVSATGWVLLLASLILRAAGVA